MENLKKKVNQQLADKCRKLRKENEMTQTTLIQMFNGYYISDLEKMGLTFREAEDYTDKDIYEEMNEQQKRNLHEKLEKIGLKYPYHPMSISTISDYENGKHEIPAWYYIILKEICKEFKNLAN